MATAKIEGLERLRRKIAALPEAAKQEIKAALDESADELMAMQQRLVPVDEGDLRKSIEKADGRHELQVLVRVGGPRAHHARFVEFGTQKMSARPFFFPSYRASRKRIKSRVNRATRKAAQKVAAGGN